MRVLVTGGAGFIGSHLVEALMERGDVVFVMDDLSAGSLSNLVRFPDVFIKGDITSEDDVKRAFIFEPDVVVHLAAQVSVQRSVDDPDFDYLVNVVGTKRIADWASIYQSRMVFASSGAVYGDAEVPTPEDAPKKPLSQYGKSKLKAEEHVLWDDLDSIVVRFSNVYGPRQGASGEGGVVYHFCNTQIPTIYGTGEQTRDFIYVKDVVAALIYALDAPKEAMGLPYNVCTGVQTSIIDLARHFSDRFEFDEARDDEIFHSCLDPTRAKRLGFTAFTPLSKGLEDTKDFYRGRRSDNA